MRWLGFVLVCLLSLGGCGRRSTPGDAAKPLETVDVAEAPEAALTTEFDEYAAPRPASEMAGVLPSDFPSDAPVFSPSSLVNFGTPEGDRFIELDTSAPLDGVRTALVSQLSGAGWSRSGSDGQMLVFRKSGRELRVVLQDLSAGTRIRYEY
jgi:hypothetical protein